MLGVITFLYVLVFFYADDILLIAPSVSALQILLAARDEELTRQGMQINEKSRYVNADCDNLSLYPTVARCTWSSQCRYLGVYFVSGRAFRCSFE